jgi:hypothetical protein
MRIFNKIVELTVSNSDESKAEAVSSELPVWEVVIGMLPDVEVHGVRASLPLVAGTFHFGRTVATRILKKSCKSFQCIMSVYCSMPELTCFPSN